MEQSNKNKLRVIKTARDEKEINDAARMGFRPLVRKWVQSKEINSKYCVIQHKDTGLIQVLGDYRESGEVDDDMEVVIGWTNYYPYSFKSPFAAYLIPSDIVVGERVYVEDLIEDYVGASWSQGDNYRLEGCEAIWDGGDLVIQYNPSRDREQMIG